MATLRIEGLEDAQRLLGDNPVVNDRLRKATLGAAAKKAGERWIEDAKDRAPVRTGDLRRGLRVRATDEVIQVFGPRYLAPQNAKTDFLEIESLGDEIAVDFTSLLQGWIDKYIARRGLR